MTEQTLQEFAQKHAENVVRGDIAALEADFSDELRPQIPTLAQALPHPVRSAEVLSVDAAADPGVVHVRYVGDGGEVTIRSEWTGSDRPVITAAERT